jgi:hypothetical protein
MATFTPLRTEHAKTVLDVLLERLLLEHNESLATAGMLMLGQLRSAGYEPLLEFLGFLLLFCSLFLFLFFNYPFHEPALASCCSCIVSVDMLLTDMPIA